jgi:hypothetical protein
MCKNVITLISLAFSMLALSGCRCDENVVWSPDGKRAALLSNGLRVIDAEGSISPSSGGNIAKLQWFADGRNAVAMRTTTVRSWKELSSSLTAAERQKVIASAARIKNGRGYVDSQPRMAERDLENFREACLYLKDTRGQSAVIDVARRWHVDELVDTDKEAFLPVIHSLQLITVNGNIADAKVQSGRIIFRSRLPIEDIRVSPTGRLISVLQGEFNRLVLVDLNGNSRLIAANSSRPDWSKDGGKIFYLHSPQALGEKQVSAYINSIPVVTLSAFTVGSDLFSTKLLNRRDLAQLAGEIDISHGARSGMRVRVVNKDTLLLAAHPLKLPATAGSFGLEPVAFFKVNTTSGVTSQINIDNLSRTARENNAISRFEPNQDGTMAAMVDDEGTVSVAPLTGPSTRLTTLFSDKEARNFPDGPVAASQVQPTWRSVNELCYVRKRRKDATNELVLQRIELPLVDSNNSSDTASGAVKILNAGSAKGNWDSAHISFLENADNVPVKSSQSGQSAQSARLKRR